MRKKTPYYASPRKPTSNKCRLTKNQNSTNPDSVRTFLQVIPVKVKHGANTTVVNALLDSGLDTALITSDLAKALNLKGKQRTLNIANAISSSV